MADLKQVMDDFFATTRYVERQKFDWRHAPETWDDPDDDGEVPEEFRPKANDDTQATGSSRTK